jgi:flagellar hook protein FlgE
MAFLRSLFAGVSGLRNHQVMMDVIGNNIANINTIGFKGSRTTFSETFAQSLRSASRPSANSGGTNPMQVGLGTAIATIDTFFSQGNLESTGNETDLAIKGNAFFAVKSGDSTYYTRVGSFQFDSLGQLVHPGTGAILQGKIAGLDGTIPTGTRLEDLVISLDQKSPARATSEVSLAGTLNSSAKLNLVNLSGNLNSADPNGTVMTAPLFTAEDDFGQTHDLTVTLTKTAANTWTYSVAGTNGTITGGTGTITFDASGAMVTPSTPNLFTLTPTNGAPVMSFELPKSRLTQNAVPGAITASLTPTESTETFLTIYDSLGNSHTLSVKFAKTTTDT